MSLITDLPAIFNQFSDARQKGFLTVMDLKEQGIPLVGTYCTFMPQEIAMAAGAVVVSCARPLMKPLKRPKRSAAEPVSANQKQLRVWQNRQMPYFYFSDTVVGETTCDGKRKCTSTWPNLKRYM